ncbi:MAG: 30S ribosomal protein S2 [bacterium]|nr:30S ribosomal protein S2 [bacterium]
MKHTPITIEQLMDAGCHFGHTKAHRHPKMEEFVYLTREKVQILDLQKTLTKLQDLTMAVENFVAEGKSLILVGTKRQAKEVVKSIGEETGLSYITERWLGGTLTNFETVRQSIRKMNEIEAFLASDEAQLISKKERVIQHQELVRLTIKFGGLKKITRVPDGLFIVDPSFEHNALLEARKLGLSVFALLDTNSDPGLVDEFVPANDDATKSINLIMGEIKLALEHGLKRASDQAVATEAAVVAEKAKAEADKNKELKQTNAK